MITDAVLLGVARSNAKSANEAPNYPAYLHEREKATSLRNAGAAVLGIGGALLIGDVIRYSTLAAKQRKTAKTALAPQVGPTSAGLVWVGRF